MQVNAPSTLSLPTRIPRTNQEPYTGTTPMSDPVSTGTQGGPLQHQVSVATILEHWGTSNPLADLNTDGIVDAQDLAMASSSSGTGANGVMTNWGNAGGSSDHNGDGTVDAQDLAFALNNQSPTEPAPVDPWQQAAGGDHNGDGTVDAQDLAIALNGQSAPADPWQQVAGGDHNGDGAVNAQDLAMQLNGDLKFGAQPAEIVGKLVDAAFALRDADADGALARDDFSSQKQLFRRLDLDNDGTVGREEMTKALMADLDRFRSEFPGAATSAFAKRWLEAFSGDRGAPDLAVAAKAGRFVGANDPLSLLTAPRAKELGFGFRGNFLSAQA